MVSEHPLLTFIEDPFVLEHVVQYKKLQAKLAETAPSVQIGMSSKVFEDDLERIKDLATFINPEDDEDVSPESMKASNIDQDSQKSQED